MSRADGDRSLVDDAREERRELEQGGVRRPAVSVRMTIPESEHVQVLLDAANALEAGGTDVPERVAVPLARVLRRAHDHARTSPGSGWTYQGDVDVARAVLAGGAS